MVNYPSTAALEAMLAGVPVVYLRSATYKAPGLRSPLDSDDVICVDRIENLEAVLDDLLTNPQARAEAQRRAEAFRASFLSPGSVTGGSNKILELARQFTANRAEVEVGSGYNRDADTLRDTRILRHYIESKEAQGLHRTIRMLGKRYLAIGGTNTWKRGSIWLARMYLGKAWLAFHQRKLTYAIKCVLWALLWNPDLTVREAVRKASDLWERHVSSNTPKVQKHRRSADQ